METTDLKYQAYEALPGAFIMIGGDFGNKGHETPNSRMILNLKVRPCQPGVGEPTGPEMDIALALTIPQVAWIVYEFFSGLIMWPKKNILRTFFIRLMKKRHNIMTSDLAKDTRCGFPEWVEAMKYPEMPL